MKFSRIRPSLRARTLVFVAAGAALAASCGGGDGGDPTTTAVTAVVVTTAPSTSTTAAPQATSTAGPSTTVAPRTDPFTGRLSSDPAKTDRPALVVKVDNAPERGVEPQIGLEKADIVIEEIVEGVTRFAVVFHSQDADKVGPIRSARTTDVDLLSQFSNPLFAWSGANGGTVRAVRESKRLYDVGNESGFDNLYYRERGRVAPHNLFSGTPQLYSAWSFPQKPPTPIFSYRADGVAPTGGEAVAKGIAVQMASTNVVWVWNVDDKRWQRTHYNRAHLDGDGNQHAVENVVILFTEYRRSPADPKSPEAVSVGEGEAWVLTDGQLVSGKWTRADPLAPYQLVDASGKTIELTVGRTWIELPEPGDAGVLP